MRILPLTLLALATVIPMATPALAEAGGPSVKLTGQIFTDYRDPTGTPNGFLPQSFNLTRGWLQGQARFNETWSGTVAYNAFPETFVSNVTNGTATTVTEPHMGMVQLAFIQADGLYPGSSIQLGLLSTPWNDYELGQYGYRVIGNTPIFGGIGASNGLGGGKSYIQPYDKGLKVTATHGPLSYSIAATNGEGFRGLETDGQKAYSGRVTLTPLAGLDLSVLGYIANPALSTGGVVANRGSLLITYNPGPGRIGLQGSRMLDQSVTQNLAGTSTSGQILTAYGVVGLPNPWMPIDLIARADQVNPDINATTTSVVDQRTEATLGVAFKPMKGVTFVLDEQNVNRFTNTSGTQANYNTVALHTSLAF